MTVKARALRIASFLGLAAMLASCGGGGPRGPEPRPAAESAVAVGEVTHPNFGDHNPHDWQGRRPDTYAVHGTDTSRFQTSVDWRTARANGINFVFVKATEGADDGDPAFRDHWRAARAAGIRTGAYHFWYHCATGRAQARNFISRVPRSPGALPPVLDIEWTPTSPTCTRRTPEDELLAETQAYIDTVARHYGQRPIVYVTPDIWADRNLGRLRGADFWLRSVADHPSERFPGQRWTFWQYTGTGDVPGIAGKADINVFNGSAADWIAWLAGNTH